MPEKGPAIVIIGSAAALVAALIAAAQQTQEIGESLLLEADVVQALAGYCPGLLIEVGWPCGNRPDATVASAVIHANDAHGWTREQIADWLETLNVDLTIRQSDA